MTSRQRLRKITPKNVRQVNQPGVSNRQNRGQARPRDRAKNNAGRGVNRGRQYDLVESSKGGVSLRKMTNPIRQNMVARNKRVEEEENYHEGARGMHKETCRLSPCCVKYMATLADPTLDMLQAAPIPIPNPPTGPVTMIRVKTQGTFTVNGDGFAWLLFAPGFAGPYVDRDCIQHSRAGFVGDTIDISQPEPDIGYAGWGQAPFTALNSRYADVNWRCTGAVLRVRNIAKLVDRGGQSLTYEVVGHDKAYLKNQNFTTIASLPRTQLFSNSNDLEGWIEVTWHPSGVQPLELISTNEEDAGLSGTKFTSYATSSAALSDDDRCSELVFMTSAATVNSFEFEAWAIYECRGNNVYGKREYTRDAESYSHASTAITELVAQAGHHEDGDGSEGVWGKVKEYVKAAADVAETATPIATDLASLVF